MKIEEAVSGTPAGMFRIGRRKGQGVEIITQPEPAPNDRHGLDCRKLIERIKQLGPGAILVVGDDELDCCAKGTCINRHYCSGMPVEIFSPDLLPATDRK